jgi:hypothetical protein
MTVRLRVGVSTTDTDYGRALLDLDTGDYFNLNPSGALVLHRLLEGDSPTQAATRLAEEYAVTREEAEQDVAALITELEAAGLIETASDGTGPGSGSGPEPGGHEPRRGWLRGRGRPR